MPAIGFELFAILLLVLANAGLYCLHRTNLAKIT